MTSSDPRIVAIRSDKVVGRGSCSSIDECWGDKEILNALEEDGVADPVAAIKWAYETEGLFLEQELNQRWGEDDDPQLKNYNKFEENIKFRMRE